MRELPNLETVLIVCEDFYRGRWFIRDHLHVIEQRNSSNYIGCYPDDLTKQLHFRLVTDPMQLRAVDFHDYILHGLINDHFLSILEERAQIMKKRYNLGMVE